MDLHYQKEITVGGLVLAGIGLFVVGTMWLKGATFKAPGRVAIVEFADVGTLKANVLAVAGVARHNPTIMAFGLVLSVVLMAVAASWIAKLIHKFQWLAYIGIAIIVFAGVQMIWEDLHQFFPAQVPKLPSLLGDSEPAMAH